MRMCTPRKRRRAEQGEAAGAARSPRSAARPRARTVAVRLHHHGAERAQGRRTRWRGGCTRHGRCQVPGTGAPHVTAMSAAPEAGQPTHLQHRAAPVDEPCGEDATGPCGTASSPERRLRRWTQRRRRRPDPVATLTMRQRPHRATRRRVHDVVQLAAARDQRRTVVPGATFDPFHPGGDGASARWPGRCGRRRRRARSSPGGGRAGDARSPPRSTRALRQGVVDGPGGRAVGAEALAAAPRSRRTPTAVSGRSGRAGVDQPRSAKPGAGAGLAARGSVARATQLAQLRSSRGSNSDVRRWGRRRRRWPTPPERHRHRLEEPAPTERRAVPVVQTWSARRRAGTGCTQRRYHAPRVQQSRAAGRTPTPAATASVPAPAPPDPEAVDARRRTDAWRPRSGGGPAAHHPRARAVASTAP